MKVLIDGERDLETRGADSGAAGLLLELDKRLRRDGRAIRAIRIDGRKVAAPRLAEVIERSVQTPISVIEVTSASLAEIMIETTARLEAVLAELPSVCHGLARAFKGEPDTEDHDQLDQLLEVWESLYRRQDQICAALELDTTKLASAHETFDVFRRSTATHLGELERAHKRGDHSKVAGIIENELVSRASQESGFMAALKSAIEAML